MYKRLIKFLYYPFLRKIKKAPEFKYLNSLIDFQRLANEKLKEMQWRKLQNLLRIAYENVPYYRNILKAGKINADAIVNYNDFLAIPILNKEDIRKNFDKLINPNYNGKFYRARTSGSTGISLEVLHSLEFENWIYAGQERARSWFGVGIGDRAIYIWGRPLKSLREKFIAKIKARLKNIMFISAFELSNDSLKKHWGKIKRFNPEYIYGYASSIYKLAEYVKKNDPCHQVRCKAVFTTAESLFDYQRQIIESAFNCNVAQEYGCSETGAFVYECPEKNAHVYMENVFVEFLKDNQPVMPGELGEIVVTPLTNYCMPLIRYKIGDMGIFLDKPCPCKMESSLMEIKVAKITDMIITPKGRIFSSELFDYINLELIKRKIRGIKQFRVTQESKDSFQIDVVRDDYFSQESIEIFNRRIKDFLGQDIKVIFNFVNEIKRDNSGKLRYFISKINK
jgi:phenylacetate-CoA ligase